ncbi:MAG: DUF3618 domain-containing protein, partial [Chloroflexi bacterium]|nr:DUF3618 domain-containing protein [Chloroflexota bacterium]
MSDVWGTDRQAPIDDPTATEMGDGGDPTASSDDIEARAAEIEQTREEMTETVSAIGDRLDPANIVAGAKETVREATVGKVESMASAAGDVVSDAGSTAQQAGSGIIQTIRHNPIPAALAGIGVGWLLKNRTSGSSGSMSARSSADSWSRQGSSWADRGADRDRRSGGYGQMASDDRSASADQSNGAKDKVAQVAEGVGQRVGSI